MDFTQYISLGDSMSMDLYPALAAGAADVAVALERENAAGNVAPLGAASLLFHNDETYWPAEVANDLATRYPGIQHLPLAADRATIGDVFSEQLSQLVPDDAPTLLTLTLGLEDLFSAFSARPAGSLLGPIVRDILSAYSFVVDRVLENRPNSLLIVTTVCDPSDGTGEIKGILEEMGKLPLAALDALNDGIRNLASPKRQVAIADAHRAFMGHGVSVDRKERWYWYRAPLEPNLEGAHELRLLWLQAVDNA